MKQYLAGSSLAFALALGLAWGSAEWAGAVIVADGTVSPGEYASGLIVEQTNQTGFGDNQNELNGAYGTLEGGNLNIALTGNLQTNGNRLLIFLDVGTGGQNRLLGNNGDNRVDRLGNNFSDNGLTFDSGFDADWMLLVNGDGSNFFVDLFDIAGEGAGNAFLGSFSHTAGTGSGSITGGTAGNNNSNSGGVTGGDGSAAPGEGASVTTGFELTLALSSIGSPTGPIDVNAMINGDRDDFLSNQVLGGLDGRANLGDPRDVDFSAIGGNQFFTVTAVPEPSAFLFGGLICGAMGLQHFRKRRSHVRVA